jgi:hypothetical protein
MSTQKEEELLQNVGVSYHKNTASRIGTVLRAVKLCYNGTKKHTHDKAHQMSKAVSCVVRRDVSSFPMQTVHRHTQVSKASAMKTARRMFKSVQQ